MNHIINLSNYFNLKSKSPTASTRGLEQAKSIAIVLDSLGDYALAMPGLTAAVQTVIQIIELTQKLQSECNAISEQIGQIMETSLVALRDKSDAEVDPCLKRYLETFGCELVPILHAFEALAKPNSDATVDKRKDHRNPPPRNDSPVFVITQLQGIVDSHKALQQGDLMRALISRRAVFKRILLYHDAIIRHSITRGAKKSVNLNSKQDLEKTRIGVIADLCTQPSLSSRITYIVSSCPPSFLAALRGFQQAAHVLACIDTTTSYLSSTHGTDPLTQRIREAMSATIFTFTLPEPGPVQQRPDDQERVMDHRIFYDEPLMHTLFSSMDEKSRLSLQAAGERERSRLPLFPSCFKTWVPDGSPNSFDTDFNGVASNETKHPFEPPPPYTEEMGRKGSFID